MERRTRFEKEENGAIGIGTLIVFIAMVLVAAIAAAVLINTAGSLQDRASRTGEQATQDVSGGLKVQHMEGWANNNGQMGILHFYVALHSGTEAVDIGQELSVHLSWVDKEPASAMGGVADVAHLNSTSRLNNNLEMFTTNITADPHNSMSGGDYLDQDSLIMLEINFTEFQNFTAPNGGGLDPASTGIIKFIISSGVTPTERAFNLPGSFPAGGGWVKLY